MAEPKVNVIRREDQPGVLYLEFDSPDNMNSFSSGLWLQFITQLRAARRDDSVRVVVLRGAGTEAFSSGLNIDELQTLSTDDDYAYFYTLGLEIRECIFAMEKPVIAAVKGFCLGGGLELALCCDLVYAADNARFGLPEMGIGLLPGCGGGIHLPQKLPVNRAFEMILFSEQITAEEAHEWGFVNKVFPLDEFDAKLDKIIARILRKAPCAVKALKDLMRHTSVTVDESAALQAERKYAVDLMHTEDFHEAVSAFLEKRYPVFKGK
ncbi:MAG: enoyl-CoA hydratase/isomerase family protein [Oscillospiraceae bacterium]|nr:enoyl-CoA hydratase/isomerase family protein [Oscillospiraceae bacterium]